MIHNVELLCILECILHEHSCDHLPNNQCMIKEEEKLVAILLVLNAQNY